MTDCPNDALLQAWLDGELLPQASDAIRSHLALCTGCTGRVREAEEALSLIGAACERHSEAWVPTARLRARIEERLAAPRSAGWARGGILFSRWRIAAAAAVVVVAVVALVLERSRPEPAVSTGLTDRAAPTRAIPGTVETPPSEPAADVASSARARPLAPTGSSTPSARSGAARQVTRLESQTSRHLERAQLLLRSIRNTEAVSASELDYERTLSRELLIRNRLLRRRAERQENTAAREVLVQVEPLLLDIANLPDQAVSEDIASLQLLIHTQGIVAELWLYASMNGV